MSCPYLQPHLQKKPAPKAGLPISNKVGFPGYARPAYKTDEQTGPTPMRSILLLAALAFLPAAAPVPGVPIYREFGRWLVACDNTRACIARGFDETTRACDPRVLRREPGVGQGDAD